MTGRRRRLTPLLCGDDTVPLPRSRTSRPHECRYRRCRRFVALVVSPNSWPGVARDQGGFLSKHIVHAHEHLTAGAAVPAQVVPRGHVGEGVRPQARIPADRREARGNSRRAVRGALDVVGRRKHGARVALRPDKAPAAHFIRQRCEGGELRCTTRVAGATSGTHGVPDPCRTGDSVSVTSFCIWVTASERPTVPAHESTMLSSEVR